MALTDEQVERIERRARGTLPASESQELDRELAMSSELQKEAEEHLDLYFAFKALALTTTLKQIHEKLKIEGALEQSPDEAEDDTRVIPLRRPLQVNWGWLVAASVLLCVFGIGIVNVRNQRNDRLYDQYNYTLSRAYVADSKTLNGFTRKGGGIASYYNKFRQGLSLLQRNYPDKAIPFLQAAAQSPDRKIREDAEWFLTLAYLKNHDRSGAERQAARIAGASNHRFKKQAMNLQSAF